MAIAFLKENIHFHIFNSAQQNVFVVLLQTNQRKGQGNYNESTRLLRHIFLRI